MNKKQRFFFVVLVLAFFYNFSVTAQSYIVGGIPNKDVEVYNYEERGNDNNLIQETPLKYGSTVSLLNGEVKYLQLKEVSFGKKMDKFMSTLDFDTYTHVTAVNYEGKNYFIEPRYLTFSEQNAEGMENPIAKYTDKGVIYNVFFTPWPFLIIFAAILLAILTSKRLLAVAPIFILIALALEGIGVYYLRGDFLWWTNIGRMGGPLPMFGGLLLFSIGTILQVKCGFRYNSAIEKRLDTKIKLPLKGMIICIIVGIVIAIIGLSLAGTGKAPEYVAMAGILSIPVLVVLSILISMGSIIKSAGALALPYALFMVLWALGCVMAIGFFIIAIVKVIIPFLITFGAALLAMTVLTQGQLLGVGALPKVFYDMRGHAHNNVGNRDIANKKIKSEQEN